MPLLQARQCSNNDNFVPHGCQAQNPIGKHHATIANNETLNVHPLKHFLIKVAGDNNSESVIITQRGKKIWFSGIIDQKTKQFYSTHFRYNLLEIGLYWKEKLLFQLNLL